MQKATSNYALTQSRSESCVAALFYKAVLALTMQTSAAAPGEWEVRGEWAILADVF